jgi:hypothetical protein
VVISHRARHARHVQLDRLRPRWRGRRRVGRAATWPPKTVTAAYRVPYLWCRPRILSPPQAAGWAGTAASGAAPGRVRPPGCWPSRLAAASRAAAAVAVSRSQITTAWVGQKCGLVCWQAGQASRPSASGRLARRRLMTRVAPDVRAAGTGGQSHIIQGTITPPRSHGCPLAYFSGQHRQSGRLASALARSASGTVPLAGPGRPVAGIEELGRAMFSRACGGSGKGHR